MENLKVEMMAALLVFHWVVGLEWKGAAELADWKVFDLVEVMEFELAGSMVVELALEKVEQMVLQKVEKKAVRLDLKQAGWMVGLLVHNLVDLSVTMLAAAMVAMLVF